MNLNSLSNILGMDNIAILSLIILINILSEIFTRRLKKNAESEFQKLKESIHSIEEVENKSYDYYKKLQMIDVVRILILILSIIVLLITYDIRALNFFAIAIGAIIISLKDVLVSLVGYIFTLSKYNVGDDVRVSGMLGEIVRIKPLTTAVAGKDESGDYDGKLYNVPNYRFVTDIVERQELKVANSRRVTIQAIYNMEAFQMSFDEWLKSVKSYLDELLPKKSLKEVGNFKGYAGLKYKIAYDYDLDGEVVVKISFISQPKKRADIKEEIIAYIESMRKGYGSKK